MQANNVRLSEYLTKVWFGRFKAWPYCQHSTENIRAWCRPNKDEDGKRIVIK